MNFKHWGWSGVALLSLSCSSGQTGSPVRSEVFSCECRQLIDRDWARATVLSLGRTSDTQGAAVNTGVFEIEAIIVPSSIFNEVDLHRKISGVFSTNLACDGTAQPLPKVGDSVFLSISDAAYQSQACSAQVNACRENNCSLDGGNEIATCSSDCSASCVPDRTSDTVSEGTLSLGLRVQPFADTVALGGGKNLPYSEVLLLNNHNACVSTYPDPR